MFQPVSLFIGLRYSRSKSRTGFVSFITFFSVSGILLGVAALIVVVSVMNGFENELKTRILGLVPQVVISHQQQHFDNWQAVRTKLLTEPHVQRVSPLVSMEALVQSRTGLEGIVVQGIMPAYEQQSMVQQNMVAGSLSSLTATGFNVVLGHALAQKLKVDIGQSVRLIVPNSMMFTPMGRIPVQRNFKVTGIFNVGSQIDDSLVFIHSHAAAKLLRRKGDGIHQLRLYLDDAFNAQQVANALISKAYLPKQVNISTWNASQGALFSAVKMEKSMMWLMLSLIVAVAAFNIVSALVMVVIEKQGEIAILQTLGLNRSAIVRVFMTQGLINGLWGVTLGVILGVVLTMNINQLISIFGVHLFGAGYGVQLLPTDLKITNVAVITSSALFMTFLATLYPAYRASQTQPAKVLRNE